MFIVAQRVGGTARFVRGPMSVLQILNFLAYLKKYFGFLLPPHSHQGGYHITSFQAYAYACSATSNW